MMWKRISTRRFGIRAMFALVLIACVVLGLAARSIRVARRDHQIIGSVFGKIEIEWNDELLARLGPDPWIGLPQNDSRGGIATVIVRPNQSLVFRIFEHWGLNFPSTTVSEIVFMNSRLNDAEMRELAQLSTLEIVEFVDTRFTDETLIELAECKKLRRVVVNSLHAFTPEGIQELKVTRPDLEVLGPSPEISAMPAAPGKISAASVAQPLAEPFGSPLAPK